MKSCNNCGWNTSKDSIIECNHRTVCTGGKYENWKPDNVFLLDRIIELEQQNEELKCCGNCQHYVPSAYDPGRCTNPVYIDDMKKVEGDHVCEHWEQYEINKLINPEHYADARNRLK